MKVHMVIKKKEKMEKTANMTEEENIKLEK